MQLIKPSNKRTIPIGALYQDDNIQYLTKRPDELLAEILLPPTNDQRSTYLKLHRHESFDFPILNAAVALRMEDDMIHEARIVLGTMATLPHEAKPTADILIDQHLTPKIITHTTDITTGPAKPLDNTDYAHFYRKKITRVFVTRTLRHLTDIDPNDHPDQELA